MIVITIIFWLCGNVGILHENTIGKTIIVIEFSIGLETLSHITLKKLKILM